MAAAIVAGCGPGAAEPERLAPGRRFCAAVLAGDGNAAVARMSVRLRQDVAALRAWDADWRRRHPGERPPLGDRLRLAAWQDAPGGCTPRMAAPDRLVLT